MTKTFPLSAALSITTGKLLGDFGDMHELAEWLMGHPIWTHEFASRDLYGRLQAAVFAQHPTLAKLDGESITTCNADEWLEAATTQLGVDSLEFTKGSERRTENPLESLQRMMPGKPTIVIETP